MESVGVGLLSKSASAYEYIRRLATRGRLRPERRLSPPDLAATLQISVTPVRDALARLAAEGFIRGADGRGYFTKAYLAEEQLELEQLLTFGLLAVLAPSRAPSVLAGATGELGTAFPEEGDDPEAGQRSAEAFGEFLVRTAAASGRLVLPLVIRNAVDRTAYVRSLDLEDPAHRRSDMQTMVRLLNHAAGGELAEALAIARVRFEALQARLPALVGRANEAAARLRFP
jgi:DNA-binding GntR family transcriptional regulator